MPIVSTFWANNFHFYAFIFQNWRLSAAAGAASAAELLRSELMIELAQTSSVITLVMTALVIMMMIILIDDVPRSIFAVNRERGWEDLWKRLEAKLIEKRCKRLSCAGLTTKRQQKKCERRSKNSSSMMKKRSECEENLKRNRKDRKWGSKISNFWTYFHRCKVHLVLQPKPILLNIQGT